jgi:hypothetical protein
MIALPLTCTFSTASWEILLTNNLNAALIGVYMALTFFEGGLESQFVLGKPDFIEFKI